MTQLHLEFHGATEYLTNPWTYGAGVSRSAMLLRKDVQRHLLLGRDELGFRHVRFAGVFDDAMNVLQPDGSFDFTSHEPAFDWLMESGFSPFVGLSGVPSAWLLEGALAPEHVEKWVEMVRAMAVFVDGRYGCDAQEWHWEVWPSPDAGNWAGSREDYFRLYDLTAKAIKSVNPQLKVGGPAVSDPAWLDAFIQHVSKPSELYTLEGTRCDFVTVAGGAIEPAGVAPLRERLQSARQIVTTTLGESVPLMLSSWSAVASDACATSALVVAVNAATADLVTAAIFDHVSDIDEKSGPRYEPFHGGAGLITVNDIRKASFNAFKFLNEHIGYKLVHQVIDPTPGLSILVSKDYHNVLRILASYDRPSDAAPPVARFTVEGLPSSVRWGQVQVIRPGAGSPLETWLEHGKPPFVNRYLLEDLEGGSHPATIEVNFVDFPPRLEPGMTLQLTIPVPDDAVHTD